MSEVAIVSGLGNPGPRYSSNRHNLGFMALDVLSERHSLSWRRRGGSRRCRALARGRPRGYSHQAPHLDERIGRGAREAPRRISLRAPRRVRRPESSPRGAQAPSAGGKRGTQGSRFHSSSISAPGFSEAPHRHRLRASRRRLGGVRSVRLPPGGARGGGQG